MPCTGQNIKSIEKILQWGKEGRLKMSRKIINLLINMEILGRYEMKELQTLVDVWD